MEKIREETTKKFYKYFEGHYLFCTEYQLKEVSLGWQNGDSLQQVFRVKSSIYEGNTNQLRIASPLA